MKTSALVLTASVIVNAGCFALLLINPRLAPPAVRDFLPAVFHPEANAIAATGQKSPVPSAPVAASAVSERVPRWSAFASGDLSTLVANLRAAGFSPLIIRAIVTAQIDARFRERMNALVGPAADTPFWKPESVSFLSSSSKVYAEYSQIYRERSALLRQLLGNEALADSANEATAAQRRQYGDIPSNKIELVQRIADDYAEMTAQVQSGSQGIMLPADREKIALLAREKRADLAAILTPEELEGYEMRTSTVTSRMRQALTLMDATEEEFRAIFRAQQPLADVLYPTGTFGSDAAQQRTNALKTVAETLKAALGEQRFAEYTRATDYEYQNLVRIAQRDNLPIDRINAVYGLRDTVAKESSRIYDDKQLGPEEKRAALATLGQSIKSQILGTLGQTAGTAFMQSAQWATAPERGWVIRLGPDGQMNSFMSLPPPSPPKPPSN